MVHERPFRLSVALLGACAGLLLLATAASSAPAAEPLAVIAAVKGKVQVQRGSNPAQPTAFGAALERGDKVIVPAGGSATVFFNDGNVIELSEKSSITVGGKVAAKPRVGPGSDLPSEVYANVSRFATGGSAQTGLVAMATVRGTDTSAPILLAPRNTQILTSRPVFTWRAVEGATRYRVTVIGNDGELWNREVESLSLDYPVDADSLAPGGEFLWEVQALSDHGQLRKEQSAFEVIKSEDGAAVRSNLDRIRENAGRDTPAAHFLAGSYLFGNRVYDDAALHFKALARLSPEAPAPHEALGKVYRDQGLMDLAAAEFQQALALTRQP